MLSVVSDFCSLWYLTFALCGIWLLVYYCSLWYLTSCLLLLSVVSDFLVFLVYYCSLWYLTSCLLLLSVVSDFLFIIALCSIWLLGLSCLLLLSVVFDFLSFLVLLLLSVDYFLFIIAPFGMTFLWIIVILVYYCPLRYQTSWCYCPRVFKCLLVYYCTIRCDIFWYYIVLP